MSVGSKGDGFDNAMAESFNGLYKWELIYPKGPWSGLEDVEFATLTYVDWFNQRRLHGQITDGPGCTTPAAFEAEWQEANRRATLTGPHSASIDADTPTTTANRPLSRSPPKPPSLYETRGDSGCPFRRDRSSTRARPTAGQPDPRPSSSMCCHP